MTPQNWLHASKPGAACSVIAEIAQAHDGSLGQAHAYIDCAAKAGADSVKFQTHIARAESTALEPWRVKFSKQDETRFDYWKRMEFTAEQWAGLKTHADEKGLVFLSSPFSGEAVELLRKLGMTAWKVASGELTNLPMIQEMARDRKPLMLSTGMSPLGEIDAAVKIVQDANAPFAVFQCTTRYPSPPEAIGLNVLDELRARYNCAVGLSDHSGTIYPALAVRVARQRADHADVEAAIKADGLVAEHLGAVARAAVNVQPRWDVIVRAHGMAQREQGGHRALALCEPDAGHVAAFDVDEGRQL